MAEAPVTLATHIALLRGVNLGGRKLVKMSALCDVAGAMGLTNVRTLLQSGNLLFCATGRTKIAALEAQLTRDTHGALGVHTQFFVRTAAEWHAAIAANPFRDEARRDPARLMLVSLDRAPSATETRALQAAIVGSERARVIGRHAYIVYPDGAGASKLNTAVIDRALQARGTARNWNTVGKIAMGLRA